MYISNMSRYSYYGNLWNNRISSLNQQQYANNLQSKSGSNAINIDTTPSNSLEKLNVAVTLKSDGENLSDIARKLRNISDKGTFSQKVADSEQDKKVAATVSEGAMNAVYRVSVGSVAQEQVNNGVGVDKDQISPIQLGDNVISVQAGDRKKEVTFTAAGGDTNEMVLKKMAQAINDSKTGVTASIVNNPDNNSIKLQVVSQNTGIKNGFKISDKTGNAVENTGIANTTVQAKDAKYSINGTQYTSDSNTVMLDNGKVKLNLKEPTTGDVDVTIKVDSKGIEKGIAQFIEGYNKLVTDAQKSDTSSTLLKSLVGAVAKQKGALDKIGIEIQDDNTLALDKDKLQSAVNNNLKMVQDTMTGYNGVAAKVQNVSSAIAKNPFTAAGINTFDVYNKGMLMASSYMSEGSILNLYR